MWVTEWNFLRLCEISYSWTDLATAWPTSREQIFSVLFLLAKDFWIAIVHTYICISSFIWCIQQEYLGKNTILVSSAYYNKVLGAKWLINNKNSFLIVLKAGIPTSGAIMFHNGEGPLLGSWLLTHSYVLTWQRGKARSLWPLKDTNPIDEVFNLWTPKGPTS